MILSLSCFRPHLYTATFPAPSQARGPPVKVRVSLPSPRDCKAQCVDTDGDSMGTGGVGPNVSVGNMIAQYLGATHANFLRFLSLRDRYSSWRDSRT